MPNTFPRMNLNSKPISLIVRSMFLPQKDDIYIWFLDHFKNYVVTLKPLVSTSSSKENYNDSSGVERTHQGTPNLTDKLKKDQGPSLERYG